MRRARGMPPRRPHRPTPSAPATCRRRGRSIGSAPRGFLRRAFPGSTSSSGGTASPPRGRRGRKGRPGRPDLRGPRARRGRLDPRGRPVLRGRRVTKAIPVHRAFRDRPVLRVLRGRPVRRDRRDRRGRRGLRAHRAPRVTRATRASRVRRGQSGLRGRPDLPAPPCIASSRASMGTITRSTCSSAVCGFRIRGLRSLVPTSLALSLFPRPGAGDTAALVFGARRPARRHGGR